MDSSNDNIGSGGQDDQPVSDADSTVNHNRRHFSKAALAGGAVLLSLGNRAAWGGGGQVAGCMSVMTLNSFHPETGMFTSSPAGRPEHNLELARDIHRIGGAPDFLGKSGRWRTCEDPSKANYICLVRGKCPD
ncbi:MAG: hypothetical protein NXI15_07500 [Gammaproteobacteria bacterium]|nr:hypothetical protein [Gammaproteobacteria bacterium]